MDCDQGNGSVWNNESRVGVLIQLAIQVVINVAVVTNSIASSTGIPLPLISYGGTSATIMMAEMGLVLSVSAGSK